MRRLWIGLAAVALGAGGLTAAEGAVSPVGKPDKMEAGQDRQVNRYYVWCDGDGWHLRTATKSMLRTFSGSVVASGGGIAAVAQVKPDPKAERPDFWELRDGGKRLQFELKTQAAFDGFDFKPGKGVTALTFDLRFDDKTHATRIFVGRDSALVKTNTFTLAVPTTVETANLTGEWVGWCENTVGYKSDSKLVLTAGRDGTTRAVWDDLAGRKFVRSGGKLSWEATYERKEYKLTGEVTDGGNGLTVRYSVSFPGKGEIYTGEAVYRRK